MFVQFFFLLRAHGVPVTLMEWLAFTEALVRGLAGSSLTGFYYLGRAVLVKSETHFDQYDQAFAAAFRGVETPAALAQAIWEWLAEPSGLLGLSDAERRLMEQAMEALDLEDLRALLEERMREQDAAHHGGSHWIGTGGTSPFGHGGAHRSGVRLGGVAMGRSALKVAEERRYQSYRTDATVGVRQFELALRRLRRLSSRNESPPDELDLEATIDETGRHGGALTLVWRRSRRNQTRVLLVMDAGGSMHAHTRLCSRLFTAVNRSTHLKELRLYYFHNCVYDHLYLDPTCHPRSAVPTTQVLRELPADTKLILVGDASMAPSELLQSDGIIWWSMRNEEPGIVWLERLAGHFRHAVWLNPVPAASWEATYGRETIALVRAVFPMFELTVDGLTAAVRSLLVRH
ncbi:MAG: VWA domain-containing protein [Thermoleophilia bacterium]|nr:VWA domain-containing protein [Thermoleophilia bacterium]